MTLVAAWVNKRAQRAKDEFLVVASDSRLRGGSRFDHGPKIFPLARGDAVLAFAGDGYFAYPLIHHVLHYLASWEPARDRTISLGTLAGHIGRMIQGMLAKVDFGNLTPKDVDADVVFLLAGYGAEAKRWQIWRSHVDWNNREVTFRGGGPRPGVVFIGDVADEAHESLRRMRHNIGVTTKKRPPPLTWEPIDVLREAILQGGTNGTVGGPIQIVRVFQELKVAPYAVLWPDAQGRKRITLYGRELLEYEQTRLLGFDPETHQSYKLWDYLKTPVPMRVEVENQTISSTDMVAFSTDRDTTE